MKVKIKLGKKAQKLRDSILKRTGIDFQKYQTDNIVNRVSDLCLFTGLAVLNIGKSLLISIILFSVAVIYLFFRFESHLCWFVFFIICLPLSVITGLLYGVNKTIKNAFNDVCNILIESLTLMQTILNDTISSFSKLTVKKVEGGISKLKLPTLKDIVGGTIIIIIIPTLSSVIRKKIKIGGKLLSSVLDKTMMLCTDMIISIATKKIVDNDTINENDQKITEFTDKKMEGVRNKMEVVNSAITKNTEKIVQALEYCKNLVNSILSSILNKITFPLKVGIVGVFTAIIAIFILISYFASL